MAGHQYRGAGLLKLREQTHDFHRQLRIEVTRGFVGNQQRRLRHDRARYAHALLLAGGQGVRQLPLVGQQTNFLQRHADPRRTLLARNAADHQWQLDVRKYRAFHQQPMILKHHADALAQFGDTAPANAPQVFPVERDHAARRPLNNAEQFEQRALAGAGMTSDKRHLAAGHLERQL